MKLASFVLIYILGQCFCTVTEPQEDQRKEGTSHALSTVIAPTPVLTSLLLAALATANPALTNTLLLTNPYLATYFSPHLPMRYPIHGYYAVSAIQDSSAYGTPYKRDTHL